MKNTMIDITKGLDLSKVDEQTKGVFDNINSNINEAVDGMVNTKQFEEKFAEAQKALDELKANTELKEQLAEVQKSICELKGKFEKGANGMQVKSLEVQIAEGLKAYMGEDGKVNLAKMKSAGEISMPLLLAKKAVGTVVSTGVAETLQTRVDTELSVAPRANTILRDIASVSTIDKPVLVYAEFEGGEGDAEWVAEGGEKPAMDGTLNEVTIKAAKVALTAKISEEAMQDLPQLIAEIKAEIINRIDLTEEDGMLNGDGTSGEIQGILEDVPAYTQEGIVITAPNEVDAIISAITQITNNSHAKYSPNLVLVNPVDYANLSRKKDTTNRPLNENLQELLPQGCVLRTSPSIPAGYLFVGDFNYLNIRDYMPLTLKFGWVDDDFQKNLVTLVGEKRTMVFIKSQFLSAFVYDSFENIITAITPEEPEDEESENESEP